MGLSDARGYGDWGIVDGEKLYPEKFNDVDMHKIVNGWLERFTVLIIRVKTNASACCGSLRRVWKSLVSEYQADNIQWILDQRVY